ncbi:MAG: AP protein, partial [Candidatus Acidiferrales bacterium]
MNSYHRIALTIFAAVSCAASPLCAQAPADHKTEHIIFVMTDGLRWQEVFSGAEESLMNKK